MRNAVATHEKFTEEEYLEALKKTDYGLCVFHANNNVPDHRVETADEPSAVFILVLCKMFKNNLVFLPSNKAFFCKKV